MSSTYEEAVAAKDKFKEEYWKKSPELYNVLSLSIDVEYDEKLDEILREDYSVNVFLFDISNVELLNLPPMIDNVEIRYLPTVEKNEKA